MPILPGRRRRGEDVEVAGQPHRHHRGAGRDLRAHAVAARRGDGHVVRRCSPSSARRRAPRPRDAKHALARALVERFHGAERGARRPRRVRPRARRSARRPRRSTELAVAAANGDRPPAGGDRRGLRHVALGCAADAGPGRRAGSTASRWRPTDLDLPRERLDGARPPGRQAPLPPPAGELRAGGGGRPHGPAAPGDRRRRRGRRPHRGRALDRRALRRAVGGGGRLRGRRHGRRHDDRVRARRGGRPPGPARPPDRARAASTATTRSTTTPTPTATCARP